MGFYGSKCVTLGVDNDSLAFERGHSMQMRPRGDISKVAVRDGAAKRFENANFHDHTLIPIFPSAIPRLALYE